MKRGFTLVELMGIMVVLAAIMLAVVPTITNTLKNAQINKNSNVQETICLAVKSFLVNENGSANVNDTVCGFDLVGRNYIADNLNYTNSDKSIDSESISNLKIIYSEPTDSNPNGCSIEKIASSDTTSCVTKQPLSSRIKSLVNKKNIGWIFKDKAENIRYRGSNPNNYVKFNDELWRIIGIVDGKVKLIRDESIGKYSWDSSENSINSGKGINEWSQADLMKLLNPGYDDVTVGNGDSSVTGSLYWNSSSGKCYNGQNNKTTACNFNGQNGNPKGLSEKARNMIEESIWYLGGYGLDMVNQATLSDIYKLTDAERGTTTWDGKSNGNDKVPRTTIWNGYVGLLYPSDYAQATNSTNCNGAVGQWNNDSNSDCKTNDWLYKEDYFQWAMSPRSDYAYLVWDVGYSGRVADWDAYNAGGVRPVVNLKSSVKVTGGAGDKNNPYILE